jgi:D-aminoacyl-tRNA deacylase
MGNVGITLSASDPAGANMLERFKEMGFLQTDQPDVLRMDEMYLIVLEPLIVPEERYKVLEEPDPYPADYDSLARTYDLDYLVVASRHSSSSGKPCLTVHPTGNFGKAVYGGRPRELQWTVANPMRDVYLELLEEPPRGYDVSMEATHHSPTQFETPVFFAELGSSKRQWRDESTAQYLAEAIVSGIRTRGEAPVVIGFGGGHYCPTFSILEREVAFGHIAAKHSLDLLSLELIGQMVERTKEGVERAVFDRGMKGHQRKKVEVALGKLGVEYEAK